MAIFRPTFPQLQRGDTLTRGLVAAWQFYEGSGNILHDVTGNGHNGTIYNSPAWVGGKSGGALSFSYVNNTYISVPSVGDLYNAFYERTVCAWITAPLNNTTSAPNVIYEEGGNTNGFELSYRDLAGGATIRLDTYNNGTGDTLDSTTAFTNGILSWTLVTAIFNYGLKQIYINTALDSQKTVSYNNIPAHGSNTGIGNSDSGNNSGQDPLKTGYGWAGLIDSVYVYNRVLTADEIRLLYVRTGR